MAYRLKRSDPSVQRAVRRIATEQIKIAMGSIDNRSVQPDASVHELRKSCKKIRGLLRLVRPRFKRYDAENAKFRDIAASVSRVRDTDVLIATFDAVVKHYQDQVEQRALASIRRGLTLGRNARAVGQDPVALLSQCRERLLEAADRVDTWQLQGEGFAVMEEGLGKTFRRARRAMYAAKKSPSPELLHQWRKHCKYHWYHARLLRPIWPGPMQAHVECARALGEVLGDHHDLAVLLETLTTQPHGPGKTAAIEVMSSLAKSRQDALATQAFGLGARLLAESPSALRASWGARFDAWHGEHAQSPSGN